MSEEKYAELKKRVEDVEVNNQVLALTIHRTKTAVKRLRLEYAILLERLEKRLMYDNSGSFYSDILPGLPVNGAAATGAEDKTNAVAAAPKKPKRDPDLPKRPTNAYLLYCEHNKEAFKQRLQEDPSSSFGQADLSKVLTDAWRALSEEEKKPFYAKYEADKERYRVQMEAYREKKGILPPAKKRKTADDEATEDEDEVEAEAEVEAGAGESAEVEAEADMTRDEEP